MTLIIGDIHGCYAELLDLLDLSGITDDEPIIALGDLFDKGRKPQDVLEFFMNTPQARSIRGNHEQRHLDAAAGEKDLPAAQLITRWKFDQDYEMALAYMQTLPLTIELDEALLLHAFFEPGVPLDAQKASVLLGQSAGESHLKAVTDRAWFLTHDYPKPIICGHWDYSQFQKPFVIDRRFYGLDTRCVYGGSLTALRLPQWELISVPSRKNHWTTLRRHHGLL